MKFVPNIVTTRGNRSIPPSAVTSNLLPFTSLFQAAAFKMPPCRYLTNLHCFQLNAKSYQKRGGLIEYK